MDCKWEWRWQNKEKSPGCGLDSKSSMRLTVFISSVSTSRCLPCSKPRSRTTPSWSSSSWRLWSTATCQQLTRSEGRSSWGRPPPPTRPAARASSASLPISTCPTPWRHWPRRSTPQVPPPPGRRCVQIDFSNARILLESKGVTSGKCRGGTDRTLLVPVRLRPARCSHKNRF